MIFFGEKFGLFIRNPYLCNLLLLIIGAFGRQSSMRCVAIISRPVSSLFGDGVTPRSDWRDEGTLAIDFVECQRDSANTKQFEFLELRRDSEKSK